MHPASRILLYLMAALAIPGLPFFLPPILIVLALAGLHGRQPWRLVWRTRWLLLVLLLGYAYNVPGSAAFSLLGAASPTLEGLARGGRQAVHLLALLLWLDLLVLRLPTADLMSGLYTLLRPLRRFGVDIERATLRLGLTLRAIEGLERGRGNLKRLFAEEIGQGLPDTIQLTLPAFGLADYLVPLTIGVLLLWLNASP
jgi:energy-coupling factor transporter transmembrane protein EcfT